MKNWTELENSSFFDANARERALGMVDKGTFTEFLNPLDRYCSPHRRYLGLLWNLMTVLSAALVCWASILFL